MIGDRAVGYCEEVRCQDFTRGVYLMGGRGRFYCPSCGCLGLMEREGVSDEAKGSPDAVYKTVRIHFDFDPTVRKYRHIAVVDINELRYGSTYEMYSPLISTESRALKLAESTLGLLNSGMRKGDGSFMAELVIDLGARNWDDQVNSLENMLDERERRLGDALRKQ